MAIACSAALVALAPGCGGTIGGGDGSSTADAGDRASDAAADAAGRWSPVCSEAAPTQGTACSIDATYCEYGCGDVVICASGKWSGAVNVGSSSLCHPRPNSAGCPATRSGITPNATCENDGDICTYADGTCQCNSPQAPAPGSVNTWFCGPEPRCPMPRPRLGSSCSTPDQQCDYQVCGSSQQCKGGAWRPGTSGCGG